AALWSATVTSFQGSLTYDYPVPERFNATATRQRSERFQLVTWHIEREQTIRRVRSVDDDYRLMFPLAGCADLRVADAAFRLRTGGGVLVGSEAPYEMRLPDGSRGLVATLPRSEVDVRTTAHVPLHLGRAP